jgi:hypothetical protein
MNSQILLKQWQPQLDHMGAYLPFLEVPKSLCKEIASFFEMDHNRLGGVMNQLNQQGIDEYIYCVLCGRMTPDQKQIVRKRSKVDAQLFIDVMTWFIQESGHPGFNKMSIPEDCPQPLLIKDFETRNNTDHPVNESLETTYEGGIFFSHLHKILQKANLYMTPLIGLLLQS